MSFIGVVDPLYILHNFLTYCWSAYDATLGVYKYPLLIVGIIGYVYLATKSSTLTALTIIVSFAVFGITGIFADTQVLNSLLGTLTIIGIAALFTALLLKKEVSSVSSED